MPHYSIRYDAVGSTPYPWILIDPDDEPVNAYLTVEAAAADLVIFEKREAEVADDDEAEVHTYRILYERTDIHEARVEAVSESAARQAWIDDDIDSDSVWKVGDATHAISVEEI